MSNDFETPPSSPRHMEDICNAPLRNTLRSSDIITDRRTRRCLFPSRGLYNHVTIFTLDIESNDETFGEMSPISPVNFVNQSGVYYQTPVKNDMEYNKIENITDTPSHKDDNLTIEDIYNYHNNITRRSLVF